VTNRHTQIILASVGIVVDLIRFDVVFYYIGGRIMEWRKYKADQRRLAAGEINESDAAHWSANPLRLVNFPEGFRLPGT